MKISKSVKKSSALMLSIFMLMGNSAFAAETASSTASANKTNKNQVVNKQNGDGLKKHGEHKAINQATLDQVHKEELQAKNMYQQMINKFNNDEYYKKLMLAEGRHADSVKRHMQSGEEKDNSKSNTSSSVDISVSNDELTALKNAYNFEVNDVKMLDQKIKASKNDDEKRLLNRLKDRSQRHADSLKTAIAQFEKGNKDLNKLEVKHEKNNGEKHNNKDEGQGHGHGKKGHRHMDREKNGERKAGNCGRMNGEKHGRMQDNM